MRRRPWPIVILALLQIFVEPVTNIGLNSYLSKVSPITYLTWFINHHQYLSLLYVLALPPIMGIAVYAMKRWSYPVFVLGATWMLFENFQSVREGGFISLPVAIALYLGNVGFVGYFLLPAVKAPYMNPRMRWWETKPRFTVDFPARVDSDSGNFDGRIRDFSEGGVFVTCQEPLTMGSVIQVRFGAGESGIFSLRGKPVFFRPSDVGTGGYGIQFVELTGDQRNGLKKLGKWLKTSGAPVRGGNSSSWQDFKSWASTLIKTGRGWTPEAERSAAVKTSDEKKAS